MLKQLEAAVLARADQIRDVTIEEYGGPVSRAQWVSQYASQCFGRTAKILESYEFTRHMGESVVHMQPVGVSALIAPWNSVAGTICNKLASAIGAGCASVIKPSELSPWQTEVTAQALHAAGLPAGFFNILLGRGDDVGDELSTNVDIAKISFTGSTQTGKIIARAAVDSMKRVSLGLTGKSASIVLDDANFAQAIPQAVGAAFMNNGQACVAGTRLLVPRHRLAEVIALVQAHVSALRVGDPRDPATAIGPLASRSQYERIQRYIRLGLEQGAMLIAGGEGRPDGLETGYFVKPTVFAQVGRDMTIAREEIFGPVLSILTYENDTDAIALANDSIYGLQAYVFTSNPERGQHVAERLEAGAVLINRTAVDPLAPFGGVKQSGLGRENGLFGLEAFLEPKVLVGV
jgi:aldehyde dehydrogenase (NAD+)